MVEVVQIQRLPVAVVEKYFAQTQLVDQIVEMVDFQKKVGVGVEIDLTKPLEQKVVLHRFGLDPLFLADYPYFNDII